MSSHHPRSDDFGDGHRLDCALGQEMPPCEASCCAQGWRRYGVRLRYTPRGSVWTLGGDIVCHDVRVEPNPQHACAERTPLRLSLSGQHLTRYTSAKEKR